uniref:HDC11349 n=1 Tax=Drosophila melanogaster TaxID=7227 RepID=Q6IKV5_DROME|nr:TPA_inf: HDC11349 [Drosophila melanogaster]
MTVGIYGRQRAKQAAATEAENEEDEAEAEAVAEAEEWVHWNGSEEEWSGGVAGIVNQKEYEILSLTYDGALIIAAAQS